MLHAIESERSDQVPGVAKSRRAADYTVAQCLRTTARIVTLSIAGAGLSQRATADAAGVSRCLVETWCEECGLRSIPLSRVLVMAMTSRRGRDAAMAILTSALSHVQVESDEERRRIAAELQDVERLCASMRAALARGGDHG